ncbi:PLP-dependent aminotransferase family protein [Sphingomonas crusticola]|uniref:MocR-like pyridoxine biosynthesis transcription factor PdxR n=1 Tax=Sphingomonas crusticola TaxID=1697973 RepID=UPI0013C33624|nr:PLP-dependent aminotransferase family protein [Sphingomonas crusticola]
MAPPPCGPLYRQIYDRVRGSIVDGQLAPGARLPSARVMAQEMGVARGTVDMAYAILAGEGYIETAGRAGTRVAPDIGQPASQPIPHRAARGGSDRAPSLPLTFLPLTPGVPSFDLFPRKAWSQLVRRHAQSLSPASMAYPDAQGSPQLREAVAAYLAVARGIRCTPDEIIITGGFQGTLGLVAHELGIGGGSVWVEDPGYPRIVSALKHAGARPIPLPVDGDGVDVAAGIAAASDALLCVVAPAHQFPMGATLSLARRMQLLEWADTAGAMVLEDDFDGEFRYQGRPLPALKSLDCNGRVLYAGTFSKTLFPGMRLGYLVVPPALLARFRNAARYMEGGRPMLDQAVVAEFLAQGHFGRHIKRMRNAYRSRRAALVEALAARFAVPSELMSGAGGLNLLLPVKEGLGRLAAVPWGEGRFLGALPMAQLTGQPAMADTMLVGFTNVPEKQAAAMAGRLYEVIVGGR